MSKVGRGAALQILVAAGTLSALLCGAEVAWAVESTEGNNTLVNLSAADADATAASDDAADGSLFGESRTDEIVVTSRRRTERAQDVPIPIAAISGADLAAAGQSRFEELNQRLPSTNIQFNNPRQTSIAVRGLGNNPANDALESSVGVYVDGVYLGRGSMANLDLVDLSQVELLRGPQGTLFGKNTTAGVLNVSTRLPSFSPDAQVEGSYGNYDFYQVKAAASDALLGETLAGRVSFVKTYKRGFVHDFTNGLDLNGANRTGGRAQLLWKPADTFSLRFIFDQSTENEDYGASVLYSTGPNGGAKYLRAIALAGANVVQDPDFESTTVNGRQHMRSDNSGYSAQADWRLGDYTVTSITAYRSWFFHPENDADNTNLDAFTNGGQRVRDHQVTQELRLVSPDIGPFNYVTGLYWFQQRQHNDSYLQYGSAAAAIGILGIGAPGFANGLVSTAQQLKTYSGSVFGQLTIKPAPGWELVAGVRDTYEQKSTAVEQLNSDSSNAVFVGAFPNRSIGPLQRYDNNVSGLFSVSYKFTPDFLTYASVSRGAKSGAIDPRIPPGGLPASTLYVRPEVATDGEIGIKSSLLDRKLTVNANLFWTQVLDYQSNLLEPPTTGSTFVQVLANIGGVRTRGAETEVEFRPVTGLAVRLAGSFNDATYTDYRGAPCSAEALLAAGNLNPGQNGFTCDLTGRRLVGAPQWIVNPGASYNWTLVGDVRSEIGVDYAWRSWFFGSADDSHYARVPAFGLVNARWRFERDLGGHPLSVGFWVKNAFNKRYVVGGLSTASSLYNYGETPGDPQSYGVTLSWSL